MNAPIQPKENQPRAAQGAQGTLRLWLLAICGLTILIGGAFLVHRASGSNGKGIADASTKVVSPVVAPAAAQVSMRNLQFSPVAIEVKKGDVVEWKNDDLVPHTATSAAFDSGTIVSGKSWRHTFTKAGKFSYVCRFHQAMKGVVTVK